MSVLIALTAAIVGLGCAGAALYYRLGKKDARKSDVAFLGWLLSAIVYNAFASTTWWIKAFVITALALGALFSVLKLRKVR